MPITKFESALPFGRRRILAIGAHYADAITQVQARGLPAAIELVSTMAGVSQRMGLARSVVKACAKFDGCKPHRIRDARTISGRVQRLVETPSVSWRYQNHRQVAHVAWMPAIVVSVPDRVAP